MVVLEYIQKAVNTVWHATHKQPVSRGHGSDMISPAFETPDNYGARLSASYGGAGGPVVNGK